MTFFNSITDFSLSVQFQLAYLASNSTAAVFTVKVVENWDDEMAIICSMDRLVTTNISNNGVGSFRPNDL